MAWFLSDDDEYYSLRRRGPEWKHGWAAQTMSSISLPPLPLLAVFAIVILFMSLSEYTYHKAQMHRLKIDFKLLLFLLPVLLIFIMRSMSSTCRSFNIFHNLVPRPGHDSIYRAGSSPWGVAVWVVLLLVMISYQSSVHSHWFGPLRSRSYY
ncbi:hypothetical protein BVC80_8873g26 [Macleaya cordata]|uniref:Transmembrane protein n=1 Tax=Macleaya cordata TaxID=56857 RepID=A0A200Q373_MACCD|nr:hypothetical protein BVC80_8873g26 [Macleaya cordata]